MGFITIGPMPSPARVAARRGRPPSGESLGRDDVIRAAADLVDREGWNALSLARLARELGRHATSLYAHVSGLDDLRRGVSLLAAEELADKVWSGTIGKIGAEALAAIALEYRTYAAAHPGRTGSLSGIDRDEPEFATRMTRLHEPLAATFRSFGLDERQAASAHQIFGATINGLVNTGGAGELDQAVALFVVAMSTGAWPVARGSRSRTTSRSASRRSDGKAPRGSVGRPPPSPRG
jgi:AcrR family transcriptional regulator